MTLIDRRTGPVLHSEHGALLRDLVAQYCREERSARKPAFQVFGPLVPDSVSGFDGPGCYAIYDEEDMLRYVGMAERKVGQRAKMHFRKTVQESRFWRPSPAVFIDIVTVNDAWEGPSLEAYLTAKTNSIRSPAVSP